ncbi:Crotonase superfamily [Trema orientale]|uniref:Crotonase superfamily n=1 Tax=Trema orientale TaxID=63057 RepID=A0A2P5CVS2_TREOI|nr:Crotonase superfamily [Trema orientale]
MQASRILRKSLGYYSLKKQKAIQPFSVSSIFHETENELQKWTYCYQTRRTLILERSSSQLIKLHRLADADSGIVEVNLDRPERKNAIGKDFLRGFQESLEEISKDSSANVILIRSFVPKVFCAGADLKVRRVTRFLNVNIVFLSAGSCTFSFCGLCFLRSGDKSKPSIGWPSDGFGPHNGRSRCLDSLDLSERREQTPAENESFVNSLRSSFTFLEKLSIPSIAVVEGAALGGGLEMALACDLRICGEDVVLGLPETGLAIIPGAGATQRLPRLIGKAQAKELILTGKRINGTIAMSIGLVNYCVPAGEVYKKALEIAREINEKGPLAIRMAKKAIDEGLEVNMASSEAIVKHCYAQLLYTKDRLEGLAAFAEKRKPKYKGE